ncbi:unnamed protein product [Amoebophrya sp. A25]|nr:unnamed protein product [Amoebophrya sp. A25]|eukprot:GSA25T00023038001.1
MHIRNIYMTQQVIVHRQLTTTTSTFSEVTMKMRFVPSRALNQDMLELAANRRETSRLACQIMLHQFKFENGQRTTPAKNPGGSTESSAYGTRSKGKNTITITLPSKVNNLMDFIPFEDPK